MTLHVGSEVGMLRDVIVHRPDLELKRLTPTNKDEFLFDDVLWGKHARQEHDAFADALRVADVQVHLFDELLHDTVAVPEAKRFILDSVLDERVYGPTAIDSMRNAFDAMDDETLTGHLVGGISKWHPMFADQEFDVWSDGSASGVATTEGGDIFVLGRGAVMVGMSERTTPQGA